MEKTNDLQTFEDNRFSWFFCVRANSVPPQPSSRNSITNCLKVQKSTMFFLQAALVWVVLCLPGNIVTLILYQRANNLRNQVSPKKLEL